MMSSIIYQNSLLNLLVIFHRDFDRLDSYRAFHRVLRVHLTLLYSLHCTIRLLIGIRNV